MKEEKKAKEVRDKIKEKRGKKYDKTSETVDQQSYEQIGPYRVYIEKILGEGAYSKVFKAKHDQKQEVYACKRILKDKLQNFNLYQPKIGEEMAKRVKRQRQFQKQLAGVPHIVELVDTFQNSQAFYFIMEYCQTDLGKVIREKGTLTEDEAIRYFSHMVEGYQAIFSRHAFHRDLKPENLLIKDDQVKISDFGFVKIFTELDNQKQCQSGKNKLRTQSKVGTIKYMAPDVLNLLKQSTNVSYNAEKSDIWSMGIILYKMLYGKEPFQGKDEEQIMKNITQKQIAFPDTAKISPDVIKNTNVSSQVKKLLTKMIEKDENTRIGFKKLYKIVKELQSSRQQEKKGKEVGKEGEGEAKNKKEQLLIVYNKILVQLYTDDVNYASLREIGLENYHQVTFKLMTLIHQKRTNYLQTEDQENEQEVNQKIKQDISSYHNTFNIPIKNAAKLEEEQTLEALLIQVYQKIKAYEEFELLINQVLIFLINLLLLLSLELNICEPNFVYIESIHLEKKKKDVILKYWTSTLKNIDKKINGVIEEPEQPQRKSSHDKKHKKRAKEDSEGKNKEDKSVSRQKSKHKSRQRSQNKHKSREKKSRKEK